MEQNSGDKEMPTKEMLNSGVSFKHNFGSKIVEVECPHCHDRYHIEEGGINSGDTHCWRCHKLYLQRLCTTSNFRFVVDAVHRLKGC